MGAREHIAFRVGLQRKAEPQVDVDHVLASARHAVERRADAAAGSRDERVGKEGQEPQQAEQQPVPESVHDDGLPSGDCPAPLESSDGVRENRVGLAVQAGCLRSDVRPGRVGRPNSRVSSAFLFLGNRCTGRIGLPRGSRSRRPGSHARPPCCFVLRITGTSTSVKPAGPMRRRPSHECPACTRAHFGACANSPCTARIRGHVAGACAPSLQPRSAFGSDRPRLHARIGEHRREMTSNPMSDAIISVNASLVLMI